ncbi:IclR family transcriptional regulator [Xylophilus sp.]|uniref:IclR family transcriptional regulator n=1 Tax=Xylophilus sp. TaxID=2653893 RepID=UPI0013BB01DA|nr:IclR family transcriptional regulator [Xylophilus sp.]KAF1048346.1 MAG: DNA-binding transcriptional repressor YiaJ [Xylophilus sp.]
MPSASPTDAAALAGTQTLMRGLTVVQAVADGASDLKALCAATGMARSTAHRLASLLVQERYLRLLPGTGYALGPQLIALGFQAREGLALVDVARGYLDELARHTGDTIHLVERDGDEALYIEKIAGTRGLQMRSRVGQRMPLAYTGVGKALLLDDGEAEWKRLYQAGSAAVPQAARRLTCTAFVRRMRSYAAGGYAYDLEDNEPSIRCVAAPIRGADGAIAGGLSVTSTVPYLSLERMEELRPRVIAAAAGISMEMGWRPPR